VILNDLDADGEGELDVANRANKRTALYIYSIYLKLQNLLDF
jgi:hypothetical protein